MLGNVSEWCLDWRSELYGPYPGANVTDPVGASSGTDRVVRGGSWFDSAAYDRSAFRHWLDPEFRNCYLGFRLALAPSHESEEKALNESLN
jgi:formylglycine-generating enzyme required for sulfatase activity